MTIPIGKTGKILQGQEQGNYVRVIFDKESTGGFLILTSDTSEMLKPFDSWVADEAALKRYFEESQWEIGWDGV